MLEDSGDTIRKNNNFEKVNNRIGTHKIINDVDFRFIQINSEKMSLIIK